ncbi:MAG: aminotransferase class I/II-fold pyridoxal phosphate-dependent enzyme [Solirubrobacterales bacterium]
MPEPGLTDLSLERLRGRRSAKWTEYGPDVLPSWVAEMDFPLAAPVKRALADAIERDDTGYANPDASGLAEALAGFLGRRQGWAVDPAQVVTCNDVVAGLTDLLTLLLEPGDRVVLTPPVYHPFFTLVPEAGCGIWEVPLAEGRALDLDGIAAAFAAGARAMLLCNPHNPTGGVAGRHELAALADLAAEHDAWILADEIHAPLTLSGAEHVPFLTVSGTAAERGIALVSASKAFNLAGLGCAQIVTAASGPRAAVAELPFSARHCGHLGAIAAEAAYRDGDEWLDAVLGLLDGNRTLLADLLEERLPEARYVPPRAGYLAWIDLSAYGLGADPAAPILERGRVAFSSGPMFGTGGEGHVRLNAGTSPELIAEAVGRMAEAIDA